MDPHHIFAAATATAPKLQVASSKAAFRARGDIATTIETKFEGLTKQFQEEVGTGPNAESVSQFTQTYKSVVSQTINGTEVVKREIQREDGEFRAYVLMRMPIGQAQEELLARVRKGQNAFTRFRASRAFEELEQEVDGYRQRQKEQAARRTDSQRKDSQTDGQEEPPGGPTQESDQEQTQTEPQKATPSPEEAENKKEENEKEENKTDEEAPNAEVKERQTEDAETRESTEKPGADQVQARETEDGQQQGGPVSEAQRIESSIRTAAEPWMDVPYQFGGESKNGVDCSALTQALYEEAFGVDLPRTTGKQVNRGGQVGRSEIRSGDLIFFRTADQQKHVGVYLDNGKFLHASSSQGVTISPLRHSYWRQNYWTARRLPAV